MARRYRDGSPASALRAGRGGAGRDMRSSASVARASGWKLRRWRPSCWRPLRELCPPPPALPGSLLSPRPHPQPPPSLDSTDAVPAPRSTGTAAGLLARSRGRRPPSRPPGIEGRWPTAHMAHVCAPGLFSNVHTPHGHGRRAPRGGIGKRRRASRPSSRLPARLHSRACNKLSLDISRCEITLDSGPCARAGALSLLYKWYLHSSSRCSPVSSKRRWYARSTFSRGSCCTCSFHMVCCSRVRCGLGGSSKR